MHAVIEARRAAPAILYLPHLQVQSSLADNTRSLDCQSSDFTQMSLQEGNILRLTYIEHCGL